MYGEIKVLRVEAKSENAV